MSELEIKPPPMQGLPPPGHWVAVELDGCLAHYDGWKGHEHIGEPIQEMVFKIKRLLFMKIGVRVLTHRVGPRPDDEAGLGARASYCLITEWCVKHLGEPLPVTNCIDVACVEILAAHAKEVVANTGLFAVEVERNQKQFFGHALKAFCKLWGLGIRQLAIAGEMQTNTWKLGITKRDWNAVAEQSKLDVERAMPVGDLTFVYREGLPGIVIAQEVPKEKQ